MNKEISIKTVKGDLNILELSKDRKNLEEKLIASLKRNGVEYLGSEILGYDWHWHGEGDADERDTFFYRNTCGSFKEMITYGVIPDVQSDFLINESLSSKIKRISSFVSKKSYFESLVYDLLKEHTGKDFKVFSDKEAFSASYSFPIGKINFGLFLNSYDKEQPFETKEKELYQDWVISFYTKRP